MLNCRRSLTRCEILAPVGVGLFRSEFLVFTAGLNDSGRRTVRCVSRTDCSSRRADGAIVRLFDVGGEIDRDLSERPERNPALGLRAIRFDLRHKEIMRAQVRAILRAAAAGPLSLVIPMVADVADVRMAKRVDRRRRATADCEESSFRQSGSAR